MLKPAVFLDRDGTINREKNYLFKKEDFEYMPGVVDGLRKLNDMGFLLVVITNQSGIARGYYEERDVRLLNKWMVCDLRQKGVEIAGVYYCPHYYGGTITRYAVKCNCRKPATGLFWKAHEELGIDMDSSFAIGDRLRDLTICKESGVSGICLGIDGQKEEERKKLTGGDICYCRDFKEAVNIISRQKRAL